MKFIKSFVIRWLITKLWTKHYFVDCIHQRNSLNLIYSCNPAAVSGFCHKAYLCLKFCTYNATLHSDLRSVHAGDN
jgi:hypothetical protein